MDEETREEAKAHEGDWGSHATAGFREMRAEMKDKMKDFPSREFRVHTKAARREMLLALRSLLDLAIDRLEEKPKPEEPNSGRIIIE